jgi:hypothetical protein
LAMPTPDPVAQNPNTFMVAPLVAPQLSRTMVETPAIEEATSKKPTLVAKAKSILVRIALFFRFGRSESRKRYQPRRHTYNRGTFPSGPLRGHEDEYAATPAAGWDWGENLEVRPLTMFHISLIANVCSVIVFPLTGVEFGMPRKLVQ